MMCVNNAGRKDAWVDQWPGLENGGKSTMLS